MSDVSTNRDEQGRGKAGSGESMPQELLRIRIDVPIGTSYLEIQASIFRQAWQLTGTQLRAAIALGITPDTISRVLRRCDRLGIGYPKVLQAWPVVTLPEPPPAIKRVIERSRQIDRVNNLENQSPAVLTPSPENAQEEVSPPSAPCDDTG